MFQDTFALHGLFIQLKPWLTGSYLQKIWQTGPEDYLLAFYRPPSRPTIALIPQRDLRLRLSLVPGNPFVHPWLEEKPPAQVPSSFCMLVRKHCVGKPIGAGSPHYLPPAGLERVVELPFPEKTLIIEMWERRPNLLLCQRSPDGIGKILGGHRLGHFERKLIPGKPYAPPSQGESGPPDASTVTGAQLVQLLDDPGKSLRDFLLDRLFGLSPSAIDEIARRADLSPTALATHETLQGLALIWDDFWLDFWGGQSRPGITSKKRLTCWRGPRDQPLDSLYEGATLLGKSTLSATDEGGSPSSGRDHWLKVGGAPLLKSLQAALKRNQRKVEAMKGDLDKISEADVLQEKADLLLAYQSQIQGPQVHLPRFDASGALEINLEPGLTPSQQAQRLYRQAKKYRRSRVHLEPRLEALAQEQANLEELRRDLEQVQSPAQLEALSSRLAGLLAHKPAPGGSPTRKQASDKEPRRYSFGRYSIWVGRSPRQNDLMVTRLAARDDLWLHVREGGGAHVLLKGAGPSPDLEAIEAAAVLAARHSSRKLDSKVEIVFLPARKVKKPPGSPPGFVIYHNEMSITVDPQQSIEVLEVKNGLTS